MGTAVPGLRGYEGPMIANREAGGGSPRSAMRKRLSCNERTSGDLPMSGGNMPRGSFALAIATSLAFACADAQAPRDPDGFRNNYPHAAKASFWAWKWEQLSKGM